jgi:hypothetical protein
MQTEFLFCISFLLLLTEFDSVIQQQINPEKQLEKNKTIWLD